MAFLPEQALTFLQNARQQDRLAHAYLLTGQPGSGKRQLATDFAALLQNVPANEVWKHPDVYAAEPESKSRRIVIEQIRELERGLQMRSTRGGRKIGVIFDADRMQPQASNAFLKTLEEPPAQSLLLLVTAYPELLLDTIISRCILLPLAPSAKPMPTEAETQLIEALARYFQSKTAGLSGVYGLVRTFTALLQAEREKISAANEAELKGEEKLYKQTTEAGKWLEDREDYFKALTESRYLQSRFTLVDVVMQWFADALRQQSGVTQLDLPEWGGITAQLAQKISTPELLKRLQAIEQLRENLNRNIQEALAVEVAFLSAFGS
jgi:DNA polymerase-3 subunit delta'